MFARGLHMLRLDLATITQRLFYTARGQLIISALFGLALAVMFQRVCDETKDKKCVIIKPPPIEDVKNKVFRVGDACYTYEPAYAPCK